MAWFSLDCNVHSNPKTFALASALKLDVDTTVGKLSRLWAWAMSTGNETGDISHIPADELADIMRWKKKPETLVSALEDCGFIDRSDSTAFLHDWDNFNGRHASKLRRDRERKFQG